VKDNWIFQNIKDNVNVQAPIFWQTYVQCYKLNKVMWQFDMVFIQTLNKFCTTIENIEDIQFFNSIYNQQPSNNFTIIYLFYTNKLVKNTMKMCFIHILSPTFIFKARDINHQSWLPSYKLSNNPSKTKSLHYIFHIKKICWLNYMLVICNI
jgi:hypothetical protein